MREKNHTIVSTNNKCPKHSFVQQIFFEPSSFRIELIKLNTPYHFFLFAFRTHAFSLLKTCFTDFQITIKCLGKNSYILIPLNFYINISEYALQIPVTSILKGFSQILYSYHTVFFSNIK